jgi:hypothetical protein
VGAWAQNDASKLAFPVQCASRQSAVFEFDLIQSNHFDRLTASEQSRPSSAAGNGNSQQEGD